jgi:aconitase A
LRCFAGTILEYYGPGLESLAYVGSSATRGLRDFAVAARIVDGRHIDGRVSFDINPTSRQILENLTALGFLGKLIRAGARIHQAGCNGCIGMGQAPATGASACAPFREISPAALVLRRIRFIFAVRKLPRLRR